MKKLGRFFLCLFALAFGQKEGKPLKDNKQLIQMNEMESMEDSVVPKRLSYQGLLTKANGQPVSDGDYQIIFKLFDSKTDGNYFWEESQIVSINDGLINIILGANTPIEKVPDQAYLCLLYTSPSPRDA